MTKPRFKIELSGKFYEVKKAEPLWFNRMRWKYCALFNTYEEAKQYIDVAKAFPETFF